MKLFNSKFSLIALAGALTFAGCEDVPAPYEINLETTPSDVILEESFANSFGDFSPVTVKGTPWVISHSAATATGYDNSTKTTTASDAYLISPNVDLTDIDTAHVSFQYILRYYTNYGQPKQGVSDELLITDNYTGDPTTTTWVDITPALTEGADFNTWYNADVNIPESYLTSNIVIALHYTCEDNSSTWEVKNLQLSKGSATIYNNDKENEEGKGFSIEDPLLASEALALITNGNIPTGKVYIKGKVVSIEEISTSYGNATYYISDDGTADNQLLVYRGYSLNGEHFSSESELKKGDELIIFGELVNFKGNTPEVTQGSEIVFRNSDESGSDNPIEDDSFINESFGSSFGTFTAVTIKGTPWVISYSAATATGYDNSTKTTTASDAYLVSKAIDLSGTDAANVAYQYILRYATNNGQPKDGVKNELLISDNYTGDPATTTWTDITPAMTEGKDWNTWFDAKVNVPAAMLKASIVVALHYTCSDNSATWEVKNFKVSKGIAGEQGGEQGGTDTPSVEPTGDNLVGNGDFETWADGLPANWKTASTAGNANLSQSSDAHSGSYSVNVEGVTSANKRLGYQEITLKAGTYNIRFYAKAATATGGSVRPGYVPVKADGTVGSYLYGDYVNGLTTETWVECIHSFTLTEETKISLVVMCSKNPGGNVLIDDYSLTTSDGGLVK